MEYVNAKNTTQSLVYQCHPQPQSPNPQILT